MGIRPFSWGNFRGMPDVPEFECSGDFDEDACCWCSEYDRCKDAEYVDDWEKYAKENEDD